MIKTKEQLRHYLEVEAGIYKHPFWGYFVQREGNLKYLFFRNLRKAEYHFNNGNKLLYEFYMTINQPLRYKLGFQIPINTVGCGIHAIHFGWLIINYQSTIGENCIIYPGVVLGGKENGVPVIGNNCFLGLGSKILGGVTIGNNCTIAPNAVVTHSFPDNSVIAGNPAKLIKIKDNYGRNS